MCAALIVLAVAVLTLVAKSAATQPCPDGVRFIGLVGASACVGRSDTPACAVESFLSCHLARIIFSVRPG